MSEPENLAERVDALMAKVLYKETEIPTDGTPPPGAIIVEGVIRNFGFHPERFKEAKPELEGLIKDIAQDGFYKDKGGGGSFLDLCEDKNGVLWGQHKQVEALIALAIAAGYGGFCAPREMWGALPGGVPYVYFDLTKPS